MEKSKNIRINRLTNPVPEHRINQMRSVMEFHDMPTVMVAMLKYMPESSFQLMLEDLKCAETFMLEQRAIFEEGGLPGQGAMKVLVGKGPEKQLDDAECAKIGRIIASMRSYPRQYYVGMMNFLGASCRIHHLIHDAYIAEVRKQVEGSTPSEQVPDVVNRMFPGKEMPTESELKEKEKAELERLKELHGRAAQAVNAENEQEGQEEYRTNFQRERSGTQPAQQTGEQTVEKQKEEPEKKVKMRAQEFAQTEREKQKTQQQEEVEIKPEEKTPEAIPEKKPEKKKQQKPAKVQFKQYVPQLNVSKGFVRPSFNRMMRK